MVRLATLIFFLTFAVTAFAQGPSIKFDSETHDFGEISEGTLATHEFSFTNNGDEPLLITDVKAGCGCTTPSWPREPIKPGETGTIKAVYNSNGRPGVFNKDIAVTTNTKKSDLTRLYIRGNVIPKEQ